MQLFIVFSLGIILDCAWARRGKRTNRIMIVNRVCIERTYIFFSFSIWLNWIEFRDLNGFRSRNEMILWKFSNRKFTPIRYGGRVSVCINMELKMLVSNFRHRNNSNLQFHSTFYSIKIITMNLTKHTTKSFSPTIPV